MADLTKAANTPAKPANGTSAPQSAAEKAGRGQLPEGYERVNSAAPVWLVKEKGVIMEGELIGRFRRKGDQSQRGAGSPFFYQFKITGKSVAGTTGSKTEDTQETVMVHAGEIISVDESEALRDLEPFVDDGGKYQVCLVFGQKQTVKGTNRTFWPIEIGRKVLAHAPAGHRNPGERAIT